MANANIIYLVNTKLNYINRENEKYNLVYVS